MTTVNIREEIYNKISKYNYLWSSKITDEILKIFEKVIDEKIKDLESKYEVSIFAELHKQCLISLKDELVKEKSKK